MALKVPPRPTRGADANAPYVRMAEAELAARDAHPEARALRAMWTPANADDVIVEVYTATNMRTWVPGAEPVPC